MDQTDPGTSKQYFLYYDNNNQPYYYDCDLGTSSYAKPTEGTIFDPSTRDVIEVITANSNNAANDTEEYQQSNETYTQDSNEQADNNQNTSNANQDDSDQSYSYSSENEQNQQQQQPTSVNQQPTSYEPSVPAGTQQPTPYQPSQNEADPQRHQCLEYYLAPNNGDPAFIPPELKENILTAQLVDYANQTFRHEQKKVFKKVKVDMDKITRYSPKPIETTLLNIDDKRLIKLAVRTFKIILGYSGALPIKGASETALAKELIDILNENPQLVDEVYFQLIKQTRDNPNTQIENQTWSLLLMVSTIFPSSPGAQNCIKSYLAQASHSCNSDLKSKIQFTFIRFTSRNYLAEVLKPLPSDFASTMPNDAVNSTMKFDVSIYAQIWNQSKSHGACPIPHVEYAIIKQLLLKNSENTEGIFRLPGNMRVVNEMVQQLNAGQDPLPNANVHDLASLLKLWFRSLPDPTIPLSMLDDLPKTYETKDYFGFIATLPPAHYNVLKYLIGFLQQISKAVEKTKMNSKNYAIVFAPNIIQPRMVTDPSQVSRYSDIAIEFMLNLIEKWDTSDIYPLNLEYN